MLKRIFILLLVTFSQNVIAQQIGVSPYSQFGIGDLANETFSRNASMGGAGLASSHMLYINPLNPASNINNGTVIYEFGLIGQIKTLKTSTASDAASGGNLNYIGMMFPLKTKISKGRKINQWVIGAGLKPYSSSNYLNNYSYKVTNDTSTVFATSKGEGGLNQVYLSNGVRISENWSIGLTSAYVFGPLKKESILTVDGSTIDNTQNNNLSSVFLKPAITFKKQLGDYDSTQTKSKTFVSFAATMDWFGSMKSSSVTEIQRIRLIDGAILRRDTLTQKDNFSSSLPFTYNVGFAMDNIGYNQIQKWSLAADFSYADWSKYSTFGENAQLGKMYSVKLGGEYTPTFVATKSFLNRLTYRAGFYYNHTPVTYLGNEIVDFGATLGFAFSIPKTLTNFNLGFGIGQKGTTTNGAIQEQYLKMYLGVNINDIWFFKRQLN